MQPDHGAAAQASAAASAAGDPAGSAGQASSIAGIGLSPEAAAAAAAAAAGTASVDAAPAAPPPPAVEKGSGRQRKRLQQLESKLQLYMDHEDRRVKELTEGVLYELLPAVLNVMLPSCEDPLTELDPDRCRAAAGAALAASALMNAPPGFLEFLLCIPWRRLPQLYPSTAAGKAAATAGVQPAQPPQRDGQQEEQQVQQSAAQQEMLAESAADEAERRLLVNMPLHPQLVRPVLLFMYKPQHEASVPPVLRPEKRKQPAPKQQQQQPQQGQPAPGPQQQQSAPSSVDCTADDNLMAVAEALLDGATPLHCAALRGNPAQVDHLLFCGADPTRKTAVGDLPLHLVPRCGGYSKATHTCTCLGPAEQEVWECRSRLARTLIASKCLTAFRVGLVQYLSLLWLCLLAFLGLNLGARAAMVRLLAHMQRREEAAAEEARVRTTAAVEAMRQEAHLGQAHLTLAKQQIGSLHVAQQHSSSAAHGASTSSSSSRASNSLAAASAGAGVLPGELLVDGAGGPHRPDPAAAAAAAPRPVATAAAAAEGLAASAEAAAAAGGQEPVAPGTPSASEEAAAAYSAAAKGRKGAAGCLRWPPSPEALEQELAGLQPAGSGSCDSSGPGLSTQADSRGLDGPGSSRSSASPLECAGGVDEAGRREDAHRQQLLQELLSAANTSAADASPTVAAAAALAADAEHAWHDPADSLPLTEQAQTVFSEVAFKCFVRAVHALQRLNLQEDCTPLAVCRADKGDPAAAPAAAAAGGADGGAAAAASTGGDEGAPAAAAGVTAAVNARLKAAAAASGVAGPLPRGLAAAMTLDAVGGSNSQGVSASAAAGVDAAGSFVPGAAPAGGMPQPVQQPEAKQQQQQLCVLEDEQANLYCCWAESVLLKHNSCACAGCTALAVHAIRMAHIAVVRLFNKVHKQRVQWPLRWRAVGRALSRIVYVHIALMCRTEAPTSPSKASVWRAQQCLSEWDQLVAAGLAGGADQQEAAAALTLGYTVEGMVELLRLWAKTAESDLLIAEALLGSRLSSLTTLDEALAAAFVTPVPPIRSVLAGSGAAPVMPGGSSTSCLPVLVRPVSTAVLNELQSARGLAVCPSPIVKQLAAQVAEATAAELSAGARLRELLAGRIPPSTAEGMAALAAGIAAAEPFSSLAADVEAAKELHQQSCARAEVAAQLQSVVDKVSRLTSRVAVVTQGSSGGGSSGGRGSGSGGGREGDAGAGDETLGLPLQGFSVSDWQQYVATLEAAVEPAKDANVSVTKARKLVKELQGQLAAAEAAAGLSACMSRRPCGSNALKSAIAKAEAAASAVSGTATTTTAGSSAGGAAAGAAGGSGGGAGAASSSCVFSELLVVRLQAAKKRLEVERAAEVLHKAAVTYKAVADLPKLETAVLNARKLGAEELAPEEYKAASELRARLTGALRVKQQLEAALKGLAATSVGTGPRGRQLEQLAEPVEAAIREAARCEELLPGEAARATELLEAWRTSSACEAKLSRALRDGCSAATLSRLISEAAAAGVKVTSAKRILKLQQVLEAAVATAVESAASAAAGTGHSQLVARLEAAETGGVAPSVLLPARQLLRQLLAVEARQAVEAALKPHSDWSVNTRISALRGALDKAEEALGCSMQELEEQQQQQQDRQPGGDVPQQQDQEQKGSVAVAGADAGAAADAAQQGSKQQQRRTAGSAATSTSAAGSTGSKTQQQPLPPRADSLTGSDACSEASSLAPSSTAGGAGGSTAGDLPAPGSSRHAAAGVGEPEAMAALQELSLRAWQLLQQDQQQLEERERERLEQERARRERERKERQRAAAERAERGKAERETAAQERRAARAKAAAERAKAFSVVFGTSAGGSGFGSSAGGGPGSTSASSGGSGAAGSARGAGSKRDAARHSTDSAGGGGQGDAEHAAARQAASASDADAASAGPAAAAARASPAKRPSAWGKQQQQQPSGATAKGSKARGAGKSPAASPAAPGPASLSAGGDAVVAVAHARCDSYDILGDEHSKLGLDMLALLESPEDAGPSSTTAAQQHQQHQHQQLRPSGSVEAPALAAGAMQQPSAAIQLGLAGQMEAAAAAAAAGQQGGPGSHPATPKFNLVDLGGASWGVEAAEAGLVPHKQRPASAGGCIVSLSPGSAAAARVTAAMDTARQSLELQAGGAAGSGAASLWRSPLGLGIDGPSALPPLAPRGQQQLRHGGCAVTDDGSGGLGQQPLLQLQGANSFDPVTSPAGKISPVGSAVTTLGPGQVPAPAFMYRQGTGGLSSPRSYPQLQHAHPSLLQHQLAAHAAGGGALGPSYDEGCVTQTAVAISSMCGSGEPLWLMQQQQQAQMQQQQLLGTSAGLLAGSCFPSVPQPTLAVSDALQLQFEQQHQQQLLLQQYQQQHECGQLGGVSAALLPPSLSVPLPAPASSGLGTCPSPAPLGPQGGAGGGVGALSGSFAFGAPYSSSFSPAPMRGSSSLGGAGAPGGEAAGDAARGDGGGAGAASRPELLLPDDLNFSPPSSGPSARWVQE